MNTTKAKIRLLFYVSAFILSFNRLHAQVEKVSISKDQRIRIDSVFTLIKKQTNYHFMYDSDLFKDMPKVSLKKGQIGVKALLQQVLPADLFELKFKGKTIAINTLAEKKSEAVESIGEVVITGYQKIDKKRSVGAVQVLKPKDFNKVASLNLVDQLEGIAPGLRVDKKGNITIRGKGSFLASTSPLIVVDGFPYEGKIKDLNTSDIKQITVLKDAAATAIYGIKGANGVIVITTKEGNTHGKLYANYTYSLQVSDNPSLKHQHLMNSRQYINEEWSKYQAEKSFDEKSYMDHNTEVGDIYRVLRLGTITQEQAEEKLNVLRGYDNAKDIEKYFLQRQIIQRHYLSLRYGTDKNEFYASMTLDESQSQYVGNKYKKYYLNLKDRFNFNKWAVFSLQSYGYLGSAQNNHVSVFSIRPYVSFLDGKGNYVNESHGLLNSAGRKYYEKKGLLDCSYNRLQEQRLRDNETKEHQVTTNFSLEISPVKWAQWTSSFSYRIKEFRNTNFQRKESYAVRGFINNFTDRDYKQRIPYGNILIESESRQQNLVLRTQLNMSKTFGSFHANFDGGLERDIFKNQSDPKRYHFNYDPQRLTESGVNLLDLRKRFIGYDGLSTSGFTPSIEQKKYHNRYASSYMTADLSYRDKYTVSGSWRLDRTDLFGQTSRYGDQPAWSIGALWHLKKEDFFKADFIDDLNFRVSYGLAGNIDKSHSPLLTATYGTDYVTGEPDLEVSDPQNPSLKWEKSYTFNVSSDFSLWNRRLSGSLTYYQKNTKDALLDLNLDPSTGFEEGLLNNGKISNRGIEVNLSSNVLEHSQLKYRVNFNFTYNRNKAVHIKRGKDIHISELLFHDQYVQGHPLDYLYVFRSAGLDESGAPQVYDRTGKKVSWKDIDKLTIEDGVFLGSTEPPFYGSFSHSLRWKNLSVEAFFTYNLGHKICLGSQYLDEASGRFNKERNLKNYEPLVNKGFIHVPKRMPDVDYNYYYSILYSDINTARADILRLKSIILRYNLTSLIHTKTIKGLFIRASIENSAFFWSSKRTRWHYEKQFSVSPNNYILGVNINF